MLYLYSTHTCAQLHMEPIYTSSKVFLFFDDDDDDDDANAILIIYFIPHTLVIRVLLSLFLSRIHSHTSLNLPLRYYMIR